jgi:hypothetical protein
LIFESQKLRDAAKDEPCVRCGSREGVVGAHYTGVRRLAYDGGMSQKVWDFMIAHLCAACHTYMDRLSRDKHSAWEHSEEFLHLIALTWARLFARGILQVKGQKMARSEAPSYDHGS